MLVLTTYGDGNARDASPPESMRLPPPEVVASWPPPNYINPETRGPALIIVELITLPIAAACLALRLYVRFKVLSTSHWDDWMMVGAAVGCHPPLPLSFFFGQA